MRKVKIVSTADKIIDENIDAFQELAGMKIINADEMISDFDEIRNDYNVSKDLKNLEKKLKKLLRKYHNNYGLLNYYLLFAEECFKKNDYNAGITVVFIVYKSCKCIPNETLVYLRLAEYYFENGDNYHGEKFLVKLCTETVDNYEESIKFNELTDVWNKYKHFVEGKVPPSVTMNDTVALAPEECSKRIEDIFELKGQDFLTELSVHLNELSANGEELNKLNKWEKAVFYIDEFSENINGEGISGYLYNYGNHFEKLFNVCETLELNECLNLLESIKKKFPRNSVPKNIDSIQNTLDKLEEKGIDFETEDDMYFNEYENTIFKKLEKYILDNKKHFR